MKSWMKAVMAVLFIVLLLATAGWVVRRYRVPGAATVLESQAMDMNSMKPPVGPMPVATAKVESGDFVSTVSYSGTVVAQGDLEIVARVTGLVKEILVYPGDRVQVGQVLVRLDSDELASLVEEARAAHTESQQQVRALEAEWSTKRSESKATEIEVPMARTEVAETLEEIRATQAELQTVEALYGRSKILHSQGAISTEELQEDRAKLAEARASRNTSRQGNQRATLEVGRRQAELKARQSEAKAARRNIASGEAAQERSLAELRTAQVQLGYTQILATLPAEVTERLVSPGTLVMPGQVLLRLKQDGRVRLQALVPVEQALSIRVGFPVTARVGAKVIEAKVDAIFRSADPQTRTLIVESRVAPEQGLVPGAYLNMEIAVSDPSAQLSIPIGALQKDAEGATFVWKVAREKAATAVYTCVMHPEVRLPAPGKCPKCGMTLVLEKPSGAGVARRQKVKPGVTAAERVAILEGLQAGEEVIVEGYQDLADGMAVNPVKWGADGALELPAPVRTPMPSSGMPNMPATTAPPKTGDPHAGH